MGIYVASYLVILAIISIQYGVTMHITTYTVYTHHQYATSYWDLQLYTSNNVEYVGFFALLQMCQLLVGFHEFSTFECYYLVITDNLQGFSAKVSNKYSN